MEAAVAPVSRHQPFAVGERVRVVVSVDELRTMQEGHGGWNHKMAEVGWPGWNEECWEDDDEEEFGPEKLDSSCKLVIT